MDDLLKIKELHNRLRAIKHLAPDVDFYFSNDELVWNSESVIPSDTEIDEAIILLGVMERETKKRAQRNGLLLMSDWIVLPHSPMSESEQESWISYRQDLRDFTSQAGWVDLDFPSKPE